MANKEHYLGIGVPELANMAFALDMTNKDFTAPDYMNIMSSAAKIVNELPKDKKNIITLAMVLTADASRALTMFLSECTEEEWEAKKLVRCIQGLKQK